MSPHLEYVTTPGCAECRVFEELLGRVAVDYPQVTITRVTAGSARGIDLTIGRGALRFPVIVVDDVVVAVERISEADLRAALDGTR